MTTNLRIIGFHNCHGCTRKVRSAVGKIGGAELVEFDPESGIATVSIAAKHPEVIRYALERRINKAVVIMSQDIDVLPNQNRSNSAVSDRQVPATASGQQLTLDLHELLKLSRVLNSMEVTRSNTVKIKFNHCDRDLEAVSPQPRGNIGGIHIDDVGYENPRPLPIRAPPLEEVVYGYPPEFYGFSATRNPNGRCSIV